MTKKEDGPPILMRFEAGRLVPASALDDESLSGLRPGTMVEVRVVKEPPSPMLRAWWMLCSAVVKADPELISQRAVSNHILRVLNLVEEDRRIGGVVLEPMSLRDFDEAQLRKLLEWGKMVISRDLIPGVDIEEMLDHAKRRR